jgi:hypothetical protein
MQQLTEFSSESSSVGQSAMDRHFGHVYDSMHMKFWQQYESLLPSTKSGDVAIIFWHSESSEQLQTFRSSLQEPLQQIWDWHSEDSSQRSLMEQNFSLVL